MNERERYMYTERNTIWNITPKNEEDDWMKRIQDGREHNSNNQFESRTRI